MHKIVATLCFRERLRLDDVDGMVDTMKRLMTSRADGVIVFVIADYKRWVSSLCNSVRTVEQHCLNPGPSFKPCPKY